MKHLKNHKSIIFLIKYLLFLFLLPHVLHAEVDLHSHLFMNEGLTWIFRGDFFDEHLSATNWKNLLSSQANPRTLNNSDVKIMVASLYAAHPILTPWGLREAVRRQIAQAERFVRENPEWILAKSPEETERALKEGKRALILSLEGASGILETDQDLEEFFNLGIRIVTLLHLTDDQFGGCALVGGFTGALINFGPWFMGKKLWSDGKLIRTNPQGLTQEGISFARKLIQKKIWVDLSHASDESLKALTPLLKEAGQPFLYTHNALRKYPNESGWIWELIYKDIPREQLGVAEMCAIYTNNSVNNGYNLTFGGEGGNQSEESRIKMSNARKGKPLSDKTKKRMSLSRTAIWQNPEIRRKMSDLKKGKNNPNYGKPRPEATRKKISESLKGKPLSVETCKKMSQSLMGKPRSEETKLKISKAQKQRFKMKLHGEPT